MPNTDDERFVSNLFRPAVEESDRLFRERECFTATRMWSVAGGLDVWSDDERQHLEQCGHCRRRFEQTCKLVAQITPAAQPGPRTEAPAAAAEPVLAIVLQDDSRNVPAAANPSQRWQLVADRGRAVVDGLAGAGSDEQTVVAVLRRADGVVQIGLDGFLLPLAGQQVLVEVRSEQGDVFGSGRLPDGDDVLDLCDLTRPVQDGDRLRISRSGGSPDEKLEIVLEIR